MSNDFIYIILGIFEHKAFWRIALCILISFFIALFLYFNQALLSFGQILVSCIILGSISGLYWHEQSGTNPAGFEKPNTKITLSKSMALLIATMLGVTFGAISATTTHDTLTGLLPLNAFLLSFLVYLRFKRNSAGWQQRNYYLIALSCLLFYFMPTLTAWYLRQG